ncbi:MAG: radical SAM protein [Armatimonadetes bacterium]|nr:radical SAM protein [Armatimonadota bacterium]
MYNEVVAAPREILAKNVLVKSGVTDYSVNCYVGCMHGCVYCYARFMRRFTGHEEPWGRFLDVRINAPEVLAREVRSKKPGRVFVSSVCDGWQPIEKRYKLTRECVRTLIEAGFHAGILTKSKLVTRDFDILKGYDNCDVGFTLTTMDESLRFRIEPGASPTWERIAALEEACNRGIKAWAFLGPFMPGLSDTDESLDALISAISRLPLARIYADKLNPRPGVWNSIVPFIKRYRPELLDTYRRLFFDPEDYRAYCSDLGFRLRLTAEVHGVGEKLKVVF